MRDNIGFRQRLFALFAAASVSSMCVLGTVGPVQAEGYTDIFQIAEAQHAPGNVDGQRA